MTQSGLSADLQEWIREQAVAQDPRVMATTPVVPLVTRGLPTRPVDPEHSQVYICAGVIVKLHGPGTDRGRLLQRIRGIGELDQDRLWIQPLRYGTIPAPQGRLATIWPRVTVLSTIDQPPWEYLGGLLARLHQMPLVGDLPRLGGHSRLRRAIDYLHQQQPQLRWVADLGEDMAGKLETPAQRTLAHGDFHLGQIGHTPLRRSWKLLDIDNFGIGDPAWDLSAVAGFNAAGLLDPQAWETFLAGYREADGPAVPATGDPWPRLADVSRAALITALVQALRLPTAREAAADLLVGLRRIG